MSIIHVEVSDLIDARPEDIYTVLADYRVAHPAILPKPYFTEVTVLEGGVGAGTLVVVNMNVMGAKREYRMAIDEPQPGRVLRETDTTAGVVTTFTVEPVNGGRQSRVTIATDARTSAGLSGLMERLMSPPITRRIYRQELQRLADYLRGKAGTVHQN